MKKISACLLSISISAPSFAGSSAPATPLPAPVDTAQQGDILVQQGNSPAQQEDGTTVQQGNSPVQQGDSPAQTGETDQEQADALALYAIHIANVAEIKAGGIALLKKLTPETRTEVWRMVQAHGKNELTAAILSQQINVNLFHIPVELKDWQDQVKASLKLIENSGKADFEEVYLAQIEAINSGLIEALDHYKTQGFAYSKVKNFVDTTYALIQSDLGSDEASPDTTSD